MGDNFAAISVWAEAVKKAFAADKAVQDLKEIIDGEIETISKSIKSGRNDKMTISMSVVTIRDLLASMASTPELRKLIAGAPEV